jgi:hypothetical protein
MTCFEWVCTWSVCVGGAGVGAMLGFAWENRDSIIDSFLRLIGDA